MESRPNVVLIVLDTVRATHLSCYGHDAPITPNLDTFADRATMYECAISEGCWTVPSHASLFTGLRSPDHGSHAHHRRFSPGENPVLAEVLSDAGYQTRGASRNAWITADRGFDRGFDEFDDRDYAQIFEEIFDIRGAIRRHEGGSTLRRYAGILEGALTSGHPLRAVMNLAYFIYHDSAYCDDGASANNQFAMRTIEDAAEPWFLFLNYMEAHEPYYAKRDHDDAFLPADIPPLSAYDESAKWEYHAGRIDPPFDALESLYEAEIHLLDRRVGELFDKLGREGKLDESLIIIAGDHGQHFGEHNLMAHIASPYPQAIQVPLLVSEPGQSLARTHSVPTSLRNVYDLILHHATDRELDLSNKPPVSHCFGSHEYIFDDYPELNEDMWREHLVTAVIQHSGRTYGVVRGDRDRRELYDFSDSTAPVPDFVDEADAELGDYLESALNQMDATRDTAKAPEVSDRLKDLGYL